MRRDASHNPCSILRISNAAAVFGVFVAVMASASAGADDWPARPIMLLVPAAPGSTSDLVSRVVANELSPRLGQPVVVVDKAGAGGTIAMAELARARPDGYTIAFATQGSLVFGQALYLAPGFDTRTDFAPIAFVGGVANALIVNATHPASNVQAIVAAAHRSPGTLTYSSGGNGSSHHLSAVLFAKMSGTDLVHVAYRAPPPAVQAVISGEVTMGFFNIPTVLDHIRSGQVKALAVTSRSRSPVLPDVPTLDEQGLNGYEVSTWFGFIAPRGTPPEIVSRLNAEINRALSLPHVKENWVAQGYDVGPPMSPATFARYMGDELTKWLPIVKASGATAN